MGIGYGNGLTGTNQVKNLSKLEGLNFNARATCNYWGGDGARLCVG